MRISDWSSDVCSSDLVGATGDLVKGALLLPVGSKIGLAAKILGCLADGLVTAVAVAGGVDQRIELSLRNDLFGIDMRGAPGHAEIGRASCRERVCQYV